jgi:hypothetical protein
VPWLRWLAAGLSPRRPGLDPRPVNVGFVLNKVILSQFFFRVLQFSLVRVTSPMLQIWMYHRCYNLNNWHKIKVKFVLEQAMKGPEAEQKYRSNLSFTSVLDGGGWLMPCRGHFTPRKETWYPLYRWLGESQGRSGQVLKILPPPA